MRRKLLVSVLAVGLGVSCTQQPAVPDLRPKVDELEAELAGVQQDLAEAQGKVNSLEREVRRWRPEAGRMTGLVEQRDGTIALFEGCLQDIIDETNRIDFVYQYERALRTAFNGANCSTLGYFWS